MKIQGIEDKKIWEGFLANVEQKTFLHCWAWGEFQKAMGEKVWRLGLYNGKELVGVALIIKVSAKRGRFLFVPHGPIFAKSKNWANHKSQITNSKQIHFAAKGGSAAKADFQSSKLQLRVKNLVEFLEDLSKKEGCSFIRISPIWEDTEKNREMFKNLGFRPAPMHVHSELTLALDISRSEEELLAGMRKTTRNLVRRGEREGVEVVKGSLDEFYPMFEETAKRQGFVRFSREYLQKELEIFNSIYDLRFTIYEGVEVFLVKHQGQILAGAFIVFYDDSAYYHHAASVHSKVPAAYTLVWEVIKEAKRRGMKQFNFWGVVPERDTKHPWWGLSLFKRGFGGKEWHLMHAQDLPLSWKYWISWGVERARKWKRGY